MNPSILALLAACSIPTLAAGTIYYVAPPPLGSDDHPGSEEKPFATIARGLQALGPGDTLYLRDGIYRITEPIRIQTVGTEEAWITIAAHPGETALIDAAGSIPGSQRDIHRQGAITVTGAEYTRLHGLRVENSHRAGIMVTDPSRHITIERCFVRKTFKSGIAGWNVHHFKVLGNEVVEANTQLMRLYGSAARETPHEAVSIAGCVHFEVAYNHVHHCGKEGIDVKEVSRHGVVHNNYVHDLPRQGLYVDAWFGLLEDVEFHSNIVHDCEWGLALSVEGRESELRNIRIHHNVLYRTRGSGIFFGTWGGNGPRSDIRITNNTLWRNGSVEHWAGPTGSIDVRSTNTRNVLIANNIMRAGGAFDIATFLDPDDAAAWEEHGIVITHNLVEGVRDRTTEGIDGYGRVFVNPGLHALKGDPLFAQTAVGDFSLREGSPALGTGLDDPDLYRGESRYLGAVPPEQPVSGD